MEHEVMEFLRDCPAEGYIYIISETIEHAMKSLSDKTSLSNSDAKLLRKLRVIDDILKV